MSHDVSPPTYSTDRVTCANCSHLIWKMKRDCTCGSISETRCKSCGALLDVTNGRRVQVIVVGKR